MPSSTGRSETQDQDSVDEIAFETPQDGPDETERGRAVPKSRIGGGRRPGRGSATRHPRDHARAVALEVEVALLDLERAALEEQVATLEDALAHKEKRLQGAIDRYERILDRRGRERGTDGGTPEQSPAGSSGSPVTAIREFVGGVVSRLR